MSTAQAGKEDPLIAALPPQTDYITYLTLLEYQLTPTNLPTLTALLTNDDGTLAKEIGWDLLNLVLPLSNEVPEEANKCLEVVARRGNPREVVVRVAEELERLSKRDDADDSEPNEESDGEEGQDGLPTFAGEAERLHLGTMTLHGMPPSSNPTVSGKETQQEQEESSKFSSQDAIDSINLQMLLSMLSFLHPRIQTKYPSRFLATSLPAALGAYRKLPIDAATTSAFLSLLGKLSGKQRPALPPRTSTTAISQTSSNPSIDLAISSAPLPDPEAQDQAGAETSVSQDEAAIIQRLLQAVLLEVLDEYTQSIATQELPYMSWTARLRENAEPARVVPGRQSEHEKWQTASDLQGRDAMIERFVRLGKDLGIDIKDSVKEVSSTGKEPQHDPEEEDPESPTEYPTSPRQISFPKNGVLFLYIAQKVIFRLAADPHPSDNLNSPDVFPDLVQLYEAFENPTEHPALRTSPSLPLLDGILALLYISAKHGNLGSSSDLHSHFIPLMLSLTQLCSENPDPYIRDSAHAIATNIVHRCPAPLLKIALLKIIIQTSPIPNLRAVAVNWLKDEFSRESETALSPDVLNTDVELAKTLFSAPSVNTSSADMVLVQLPFYISVLNLLTILLAVSSTSSTSDLSRPCEQGKAMVEALAALREHIGESEEKLSDHGLQMIDLWSLDDALQRVKDAFGTVDAGSD